MAKLTRADLYTITLTDGRLLPIFFNGRQQEAYSSFSKYFGEMYESLMLNGLGVEIPQDSNRIVVMTGSTIRLADGTLITDDQKERWLDETTGFDITDIYKETGNLDPEEINIGSTENVFDPIAVSQDVGVDDLLSRLLANRSNRATFFDRTSVDPALAKGGSNTLRRALQETFSPIDASFQLQNLLAPRGFEDEIGEGGVDSLKRFSEYEGGVPSRANIREQLSELVRRHGLGDTTGGLSRSAKELLLDETRQGNLIQAASDSRTGPGFMRDAITSSIKRRIQRAQFDAPGSDLLSQYVNAGFRL